MTSWDWNKHNCKGWKQYEDNIVEYLADINEWRLQWEGVGPRIHFCPYCGIDLEDMEEPDICYVCNTPIRANEIIVRGTTANRHGSCTTEPIK